MKENSDGKEMKNLLFCPRIENKKPKMSAFGGKNSN